MLGKKKVESELWECFIKIRESIFMRQKGFGRRGAWSRGVMAWAGFGHNVDLLR